MNYIILIFLLILFIKFLKNRAFNGWAAAICFALSRIMDLIIPYGGDAFGVFSLIFFINYIGCYRRDKKTWAATKSKENG